MCLTISASSDEQALFPAGLRKGSKFSQIRRGLLMLGSQKDDRWPLEYLKTKVQCSCPGTDREHSSHSEKLGVAT